MKQFWSVFPDGFWRILQKFEVCSKLASVNAYVHMLETGWRAGRSKKNDPVRRSIAMIFELLR